MSDRAGDFGTIDVPALARIRNLWIDLEPLVHDTRYDHPVETTELHVELEDGLRAATAARFDIQWSDTGSYSFHYTDDEGVDWRFDRHPNTHSPEKHFHPPPDASTADAEPSCIQVEEVPLVTRAVIAIWHAVLESGEMNRLNCASNPP